MTGGQVSHAAAPVPDLLPAVQWQERIVALVSDELFLGVHRLSELLAVTPQTIRRDLRQLSSSGWLKRHHGGAGVSSTANLGYHERQAMQAEGKRAIGRVAAARIPDRASLFIASAAHLARAALEVAAYHMLDLAQAMAVDGVDGAQALLVDGGMSGQ